MKQARVKLQSTNLLPSLRNTSIVHRIQRIPQVLRHHNRSINCELQVIQVRVNCFDDSLHSIDFLPANVFKTILKPFNEMLERCETLRKCSSEARRPFSPSSLSLRMRCTVVGVYATFNKKFTFEKQFNHRQ